MVAKVRCVHLLWSMVVSGFDRPPDAIVCIGCPVFLLIHRIPVSFPDSIVSCHA